LYILLASAFALTEGFVIPEIGLNSNRAIHPSTGLVTKHVTERTQKTWSTYTSDVDSFASSPLFRSVEEEEIGKIKAALTRMGMVTYIASMCLALPITLLPPHLLHRTKVIDRVQREHLSLRAGKFTARWLLRLIPFAGVDVIPLDKDERKAGLEPSLWVCNHISMLDIFFLLALDKKLRGGKTRPIKVVYWKELEKNPITRLLFRQCGFIPVQMAANKPGEANEYDKSTFKTFLKQVKQAFEEGFDIGILPEGQLNPSPENGVLPVFSGAFTLSRMSKRPIRMMALSGTHKLWYSDDPLGKSKIRGRRVKLRAYPGSFTFKNGDEFAETFSTVVGHFGAHGKDLPDEELNRWLLNSKVVETVNLKE